MGIQFTVSYPMRFEYFPHFFLNVIPCMILRATDPSTELDICIFRSKHLSINGQKCCNAKMLSTNFVILSDLANQIQISNKFFHFYSAEN